MLGYIKNSSHNNYPSSSQYKTSSFPGKYKHNYLCSLHGNTHSMCPYNSKDTSPNSYNNLSVLFLLSTNEELHLTPPRLKLAIHF